MKSIKLWDGIRVTTDSDSQVFTTPDELWDAINWHDKATQTDIIRELYCFGKIDLSNCYKGNTVILTVYRNKEEQL